ncbi:hypothetical protein TIFTF001_012591 [Ficus carica]|uniref:Uncharacterized protein n=1 Tax=Ficus carica TaxID=3494 RepID=A0AA87ZW69_FICCA|nr:hypothetical protein TIFTF001_012591 [Ficus carica]
MGKKDRTNRRKEQKQKQRASKMAEKGGNSTDPGLDDDDDIVLGRINVQYTAELVEKMVRDMKLEKERRKKDQDQDNDHDHDHDHSPSDPEETDLVQKLEEELKFLKSKVKNCEKEQEEPDTMEKKVAEGLEQELIAMVSQLAISNKNVVGRIHDMKKYENSGSIDFDDIETMRLAGEKIKEYQKNPDELLARLMTEIVSPDDGKGRPEYRKKNTKFSSQELKKMKEEIETILETTMAMQRSLDEFEEKFQRYNVPKRGNKSSESLERYLNRLREFMQSTWKEKAEKCRQKEHRSFIEWMVKLEISEDNERRTTFKALKVVLHDLGIQISKFLIDYFLLMSISTEKDEIAANLFDVESTIKCLIVEESSVVISSFIAVVEFFDRTMRLARPLGQDAKGKGKKDSDVKRSESQIKKENALLHLIIIEVLRLEVSFLYPDLPMMLTDEVYLAMGNHLTDNVFEDKLNKIGATINGLKSEFLSDQHQSSLKSFFEQILELGVKEIWQELDLKTRAS